MCFLPSSPGARTVARAGEGTERRDEPLRRAGNPAVVGFPLDRWLCGPFFRTVCLLSVARQDRRARATVSTRNAASRAAATRAAERQRVMSTLGRRRLFLRLRDDV